MKRWYVAQVYAGYEEAVKAELARRVDEQALQDYFGEILIPSAKLKQMFDVVAGKSEQQLFPGYLLIEMEASPETIRLVMTAPRVIRFLGGTDPVPLSQKEIERILSQMKGEVTVAVRKEEFNMGSEVEITDGPFAGFVGIVDKVDQDNEKLTVMVSIFGRMTPVELGFDNVKR
jgi:transcriptional antiterminator NusG